MYSKLFTLDRGSVRMYRSDPVDRTLMGRVAVRRRASSTPPASGTAPWALCVVDVSSA